jgi:hypothetical protein
MTQQGRNMHECVTIDDKTLFVHLLVISVFVNFSTALVYSVLYCALRWIYYNKQFRRYASESTINVNVTCQYVMLTQSTT